MEDTEKTTTTPTIEVDLRKKLREHDAARYFVMEAMDGLLRVIRETRPDIVLSMTKGDKAEQFTTSGIELKEWNEEWVLNARSIVKQLWEGANLMAIDIVEVMKNLEKTHAKKD